MRNDGNVPSTKWNLKGDNMYIIVFLGIVIFLNVIFLGNGCRIFFDTLIRCLFGLVCIFFANEIISYFGGDISVKINEISACVSAIFGGSGVLALYGLQLFFTI